MKTIRLTVLVAMLAAAGSASAVIRSPFPSRPTPPYQGYSVFLGRDSLTLAPKTPKPAVPSH